jgi:hypothetical protein
MKRLALAVPIVCTLLSPAVLASEDRHAASAEAYEHLATATIALRATEDKLVEGILNHHCGTAIQHLQAAATEKAVGTHAKDAADEITAIANEGDKRVQAVRQRLLQAGHTHHTDAETEQDYIWIDSAEKARFLELAGRVAQMKNATDAPARVDELSKLFASAMQPE